MRYLLSTIWLILSGTWVAAFLQLGSMVGGVRWIEHTGQGPSAAIDILMALLCLVAAIFLLTSSKIPKSLMVTIALFASIFLLNIVGFVVVTSQYIQVTAPFLVKLFYLTLILPTNPSFTNLIVGLIGLAILPGATLLASLISPTLHQGKSVTLVTKHLKPYLLPIILLIIFYKMRKVLTIILASYIGNFLFASTILSILIVSVLIVIANNLLNQNSTKNYLLAGAACVLSFPLNLLISESNFARVTSMFSGYRYSSIGNSYILDMAIITILPLMTYKVYLIYVNKRNPRSAKESAKL